MAPRRYAPVRALARRRRESRQGKTNRLSARARGGVRRYISRRQDAATPPRGAARYLRTKPLFHAVTSPFVAEPASLGLALAFSAGLLSFLSPCVLPLIPSYLTFVTGVGFDDLTQRAPLGARSTRSSSSPASRSSSSPSAPRRRCSAACCSHYRVWITRLGGALVVVFGLYLLGVDPRRRVRSRATRAFGQQASGLPRHGARGHRLRRRMDAVPRPDPRRDPHLHRRDGRSLARVCRCCSRIRSGLACRSSSRRWRWSASWRR